MARITDYRFGKVKVDGKLYHRDVLVFGDEILSPWIRREGHSLCSEDLAWLVPRRPRVLVLGTGAFGRLKVPEETREWLNSRGIELVALPTEKAVGEYNRRVETTGRVACGLHLTC